MGFRQGFVWGTAIAAVMVLLYTPLNGRDARAVFLGPFGWREEETFPDETWTPRPHSLPEARTSP